VRLQKTISISQLRRGTPEEGLVPGESLIIQKQGGKVFELRRLESEETSLVKQLDDLMSEVPNPGERTRTNFASLITEDRE